MIPVSYDLHIHTCLSPCGDNDMTPANIVGMASLKGLDVIAITDHNSVLNCEAAMKYGEAFGVLVIPGMELTTEEEVHVVCLFPSLKDALGFGEYVDTKLIRIPNDPNIFGHQYIMDEDEQITGELPDLLINATAISFFDVAAALVPYHGLMIPAHLDKSSTSLISNLGFIPPESTFRTFELKKMSSLHALRKEHPYLNDCKVITSSDAHYLEHINEAQNTLNVSAKNIEAVLDALR